MRRWILHFAALVSLVVFVAAGWFWVQNYYYRNEIGLYVRTFNIGVTSERGAFMPVFVTGGGDDNRWWWTVHDRSGGSTYDSYFQWRRLKFGAGFNVHQSTYYMLSMPYWFIMLVAGVIPVIWLCRALRRRHRPGTCLRCGYDLRGSTQSASCPECGEPMPI